MMRDGMANFMPNDRCQAGIIFSNREDPLVHANLSSGQTECISFWAVEHNKLPLCVRQVLGRDLCNPFPDSLHHFVYRRIMADRRICFELVEASQPQLHFLP